MEIKEFFVQLAQNFIGMFKEGGDVFIGMLTGILPLLISLILAVNALVKIIGEERVNGFVQKCAKYTVLRYTVIPVLAVFFLCNPMCYTFGRFLKEEHKAAYYDATVSFVHPIVGLFPHANPAEAFVFFGIAQGFAEKGSQAELALRYICVGILVILIRGIVTENLVKIMTHKNKKARKA